MPRRIWRSYQEYLQSWDWVRLRNREFARAQYSCERCGFHGTDKEVQLHHLHYQTLGQERPGDVEVLCPRCHRAKHGLVTSLLRTA